MTTETEILQFDDATWEKLKKSPLTETSNG
jgi:hypothetical protein